MKPHQLFTCFATLASVVVPTFAEGEPPRGEVPAAAPAPAAKPELSVDEAIKKGIAFLVASQQKGGFWGTGLETRGFEVYSMVPGSHDAFRVATTALCVMALREAGEKEAHDKGLTWLLAHGQARRDAGPLIYNVWAHTYALEALSRELQAQEKPDPRIQTVAEWHLDRLDRYETFVGGWNYYDFHAGTQKPAMAPTSFGTAAALAALWEAEKAGLDVKQVLRGRATRRLEEMRVPGGAYLYGGDMKYHPRFSANRTRGSLGRSQAGNYALWLWGSKKIDEAGVKQGLDVFFKEHAFILMGRKRQYPHEAWYQTAPYYYYFGHYYAGKLVEKLGPDGKTAYAKPLADTVVPLQEPDGSWWDYAMWDYHKPYGTAYAVMTLLRCR